MSEKNSEKNILTVVNNELCFGCGTCNVACPAKAIHMEFSSIGRLLPEVNENTCTQCGLCMKVCPGLDFSGRFSEKIEPTLLGETKKVLFGRSADEETFTNAQSGGATTETLAYLFDEGCINAALVVVQEKQHAKFRVVTTKQELYVSQTSQYTPVDLVSGLPLLKDYAHVAVVGLPCHLGGVVKLKEYYPNKFNNIEYLLGLICAGTQSQLTVDVVRCIGEKRVGKIAETEEIRWRQKKFSNYQRADIAIIAPDGKVRMLDKNIRHTAKHYFTSPRCKLCFDKMNLNADIVYGDAWGVSGVDAKNGGNVIICRTENGKNLIDEMAQKGRLVVRPCPIEEISKGQGMPKKKKMVDKMIYIYHQKSYQLPGWSKNNAFEKNRNNDNALQKEVDDYLSRSKKPSIVVVKEVAGKIKRQLFVKNFKKNFRKLIKK